MFNLLVIRYFCTFVLMLEAKIIQKYKSKSMPWLLGRAQIYVNAYVRQRDAINEQGDYICICCNELKTKDTCNASHYFSRGNYGSVRFDLDNIHSGCVKCNLYLSGNLIPYGKNLLKKIGQERFDRLDQLAHLPSFKHDRFNLIDIIERFKNL